MTEIQHEELIKVRREAQRRWPGGHAAYVDGEFWVGVPQAMPLQARGGGMVRSVSTWPMGRSTRSAPDALAAAERWSADHPEVA
jgi:hypothetical protein